MSRRWYVEIIEAPKGTAGPTTVRIVDSKPRVIAYPISNHIQTAIRDCEEIVEKHNAR